MSGLTPDRTTSRARAAWLPPALAWVVFAASLIAWLARTDAASLREQLKVLQFWSLESCVALGAGLSLLLLPRLVRSLTWRDAARMAVLASAALVLVVFVAPRTNRIYYDEQIYQGIAQNLSDLHRAQMCNDGRVEYGRLECVAGEYNKQPYAFPHLLSVAYRAFGVHPSTAFVVNALVAALTVCAAYLLVLLLFDDRVASWFAALLLLLTPQQIIWSATAAVEPSAALACLAAVLCATQWSRAPDTIALAATGVASAYAAQFRPESMLILPVVGLLVWRPRGECRRVRFWWVALVAAALLAVPIAHLFAVRNEGWGTADERLSVAYLGANLRVNLGFYLADWRFPAAYTALAVLGIGWRGRGVERLAVGAWFLLFFGIFVLFYAGSYDYGADVRYSLMTAVPLAVLAGVGAARAIGWLRRFGTRVPLDAAVTAAIMFMFLWYTPLVRATTEEAWAARADVAFARAMIPGLRGNAYVLTHNPGMFLVSGVNAGQMSLVVGNPAYLDALAGRYAGGVYLHWNFWCGVEDAVQQEFCQKALSSGPFELVREHRERDRRFAVYRLAGPKNRLR